MNNCLKYGIVSEVKAGFVRVKFEEDNIVSDWLPVLVRRSKSEKESWQLEVNEHVVCAMDEHCEEGVVLGSIPSDQDEPDPGEGAGKFRILFSDGTLFEYDINNSKMTVDVKGELSAKTTGKCVIDAGGDLEAKSQGEALIDAGTNLKGNAGVKAEVTAPNIELNGTVQINGPLTVTGPTTAAAITAAAVAAGGLTMTGGGKMTSEGGAPLEADVDIITSGQIVATGDIVANGKSLTTHTHTAPSGGGPTSPPL